MIPERLQQLLKRTGWTIAAPDDPIYREGAHIYFPRHAAEAPPASRQQEDQKKEAKE